MLDGYKKAQEFGVRKEQELNYAYDLKLSVSGISVVSFWCRDACVKGPI